MRISARSAGVSAATEILCELSQLDRPGSWAFEVLTNSLTWNISCWTVRSDAQNKLRGASPLSFGVRSVVMVSQLPLVINGSSPLGMLVLLLPRTAQFTLT